MKKTKTKRNPRDVVFPVPRGYKFDTEGAIKIAKRIAALEEKEQVKYARCSNCN